MAIPTYIINLKSRTERKIHSEKEFAGRNEFNISIVKACEHTIGAIGLWESVKKIAGEAAHNNFEYFLLCEDDHQFTKTYNFEVLQRSIEEATNKDADILCGGVSWFEDAFPVSEKLFWVRKFSGLQFTVIFKTLYMKILNADFNLHDAADYKISALSSNKYFIHPFISTQKEFGYSDVTTKNNGTHRIKELFTTIEKNANVIRRITSFYKAHPNTPSSDHTKTELASLSIPTYIINQPEKRGGEKHILNQFKSRNEFDITMVDACKHDIKAVKLWESIRKVLQLAIANSDDVIIICEDTHEFTSDYCKEFLLTNIIEAHEQGCDYLTCGIRNFDFAIPVSPNRFWVNYCFSTQFIVLYRKLFKKILDEPYDNTVTANRKLSELTKHKMILYPFISLQCDFGYSDTLPAAIEQKNPVANLCNNTQSRLKAINETAMKHQTFKNMRAGLR